MEGCDLTKFSLNQSYDVMFFSESDVINNDLFLTSLISQAHHFCFFGRSKTLSLSLFLWIIVFIGRSFNYYSNVSFSSSSSSSPLALSLECTHFIWVIACEKEGRGGRESLFSLVQYRQGNIYFLNDSI